MTLQNVDDSKSALLFSIIRPLPVAQYVIDVPIYQLERMLTRYEQEWRLDLTPDFQRGHVWTDAQRIAYLEGMFRGSVGQSQRQIQFNAPHWHNEHHGGDLPDEMQLLDGLQRLTTIRRFMAGELRIFKGLHVQDLDGSAFSSKMSQYALSFAIHTIPWRRDLLDYYLAINTGGTPHSKAEIKRVRGLLASAAEPGSRRIVEF
ncbi:DUF262 domain-containing protein [Aeromonas caviae]|uniref:DUF262 domain-containing protein n=2 Tax=Aeromonas caviae TaxID=648 RepID=A0AAJ6CS37_AERCA|nr:DUF262 domain-containing protein [Aeromonas caviae]WFG00118.1 DUF262 domain-containing protein [Aeromonas caviae]